MRHSANDASPRCKRAIDHLEACDLSQDAAAARSTVGSLTFCEWRSLVCCSQRCHHQVVRAHSILKQRLRLRVEGLEAESMRLDAEHLKPRYISISTRHHELEQSDTRGRLTLARTEKRTL
jgi:hypothetical protein